jgi:hypothetical protein
MAAGGGAIDRRHAEELAERGFTICRGVLTAEQVARASCLFDALITPSTGMPTACSNAGEGGRRQLNAGGPSSGGLRAALASYGELPAVLRSAASVMADTRPLRLMQTPIPTVSFNEERDIAEFGSAASAERQAAAGWADLGDPGSGGWRGHVDWGEAAEVLLGGAGALHELWRFGVIHCTTVHPGGAAFTVCPHSHKLVLDCIARAKHGDVQELQDLESLVAQRFYGTNYGKNHLFRRFFC